MASIRNRPRADRSRAIEAGKPHCFECGRLIDGLTIGGAGTIDGRWLCEYCLIIERFNGLHP